MENDGKDGKEKELSAAEKMAAELRAEFAKTTDDLKTLIEALKKENADLKEMNKGLNTALIRSATSEQKEEDEDEKLTPEEKAQQEYEKRVADVSAMTLRLLGKESKT